MENVKTRIIENALEQFAQYGYKKTSLDDIVQNVGISKGTIYNYFKNKEDLFKQTVIVEYDNMLSHIKSLIKKGLNLRIN
jgi:AcrR family transcriptional regulator